MKKAIIGLLMLLLLSSCAAETDLPPLPTLVEFPSLTPSPEAQVISQSLSATEIPNESLETSAIIEASPTSPSIEISSTVAVDAIWLSLEGAKAYACPALDCAVVLELPVGLRFVPLESNEEWHTVRLDANQLVYIPVAFTRHLTEAEANATATATSTPSATITQSSNPTVVATSPSTTGGGLPPPVIVGGGQNSTPIVLKTMVSPTVHVVNTLIPTQTADTRINLTVPPTFTPDGTSNALPLIPTLTPTLTPPPPPVIVLPPPAN